MKTKLSLLLLTIQLYAFPVGDVDETISPDMLSSFLSSMNSVLDTNPPFDSWDTNIDDDTPPKEDDRNITTKTINQSFILSLASLNIDNSDYEKKEKGDGDNHNIEVSIYSDTVKISNTITWDPTEDEHINSEELTATQSSRDAQLHFYMCASIGESSSDSASTFLSSLLESLFGSLFQNYKLKIHALSECEGASTNSNCEFSSDKQYVECYSTNHFAIKPKELPFTLPTYIKSAEKNDLTIDTDAQGYTFSSDDYNLSLQITKYTQNDEINNSLAGEGNFTFSNFNDGKSSQAQFDFNDTAKINLKLLDEHWSDIDDDTPQGCDGRWICGEYNTTVIPHHFYFKKLSLYNESNQTFTYIANQKEMQAHIAFSVEVQNEQNNTLQNFDTQSWENPVSLTFTLEKEQESNKTEIISQTLGFTKGHFSIDYNDTTPQKHLSFNYNREVNNSINPFQVKGETLSLSISTDYTTTTILSTKTPQNDITFLYARTNTLRTRFAKDEGDATIYYEIYCYNDENSQCDKTLLPDSTHATYNDDPRWYNNSKHIASFGNAGDTTQKRGSGVDVTRDSDGTVPDYVTLHYSGSDLPFKTTMQNKASPWLIYNKYDSTATTNDFEVEFEGRSSSWAGKVEDNVTSTYKEKDLPRTNRRISW